MKYAKFEIVPSGTDNTYNLLLDGKEKFKGYTLSEISDWLKSEEAK